MPLGPYKALKALIRPLRGLQGSKGLYEALKGFMRRFMRHLRALKSLIRPLRAV